MSTTTERKTYASDLTNQQWQLLDPLLPEQKEGGRERQVDLREIINAINYRTRTGCAWEMLPHDLPAKSTVYEHYRSWQGNGTWQRVHDVLRSQVRQQEGRDVNASAGMLDSQSVKTVETRGERGYDEVNGRKRHLLVDTLGLIIAVVVTVASVQDRDGGKLVFSSAGDQPRLEKVWADGGYRGEFLAWTREHCPWEVEIVSRAPGQKGFVVLPRRWVVERTFGWLNRYRLLSKEYEATLESSIADIQIAMSSLMLRRLTRPPKSCHENKELLAHIT